MKRAGCKTARHLWSSWKLLHQGPTNTDPRKHVFWWFPVWELSPFPVYLCMVFVEYFEVVHNKNLNIFALPFCHYSYLLPPWLLILQPTFQSSVSRLYLLSIWFIFSAGGGQSFSTFSPLCLIPLTSSQSLLLQFDSPIRQQGHEGGWAVYKEYSIVCSFHLPFFLSGLNVCSHRGSQIKPKDFPQTASSALQAKVATFPHPSWGSMKNWFLYL